VTWIARRRALEGLSGDTQRPEQELLGDCSTGTGPPCLAMRGGWRQRTAARRAAVEPLTCRAVPAHERAEARMGRQVAAVDAGTDDCLRSDATDRGLRRGAAGGARGGLRALPPGPQRQGRRARWRGAKLGTPTLSRCRDKTTSVSVGGSTSWRSTLAPQPGTRDLLREAIRRSEYGRMRRARVRRRPGSGTGQGCYQNAPTGLDMNS